MKKYIVLILLTLLLIVGLNFYQPSTSVKKFIDSTGSYSFTYPDTLFVVEKNGAAYIVPDATDTTKPFAVVTPRYFPDFIKYEKDYVNIDVLPITIDSKKMYTFKQVQSIILSDYIIPVDDAVNPAYMINVIKYGEENFGLSSTQIKMIVSSVVFDKDKIIAQFIKSLDVARSKGVEARVRQDLTNIKLIAGPYFDSKKTYDGLCIQKNNGTNPSMSDLFADMIGFVGKDNLACYSNKSLFAVSVKVPSGSVICTDSTGLVVDALSMSTGPICNKK